MLACSLGEIVLAQGVIHFGWQNTTLFYGIAGLCMAFLSYFVIQDRKEGCAHKTQRNPRTTSFKHLFAMPEVWVAGLISGFAFAILSAFAGFWCVPFLEANFNLSLAQAASITAIIFLGAAIFAPITGFLIERIQYCEYWMAAALFLSALLFTALLLISHLSLIVIAAMLFVLGCLSTVYIIPFAFVRKRVPHDINATAMGMTNMLSILIGAPLLQPVIGLVVHLMKNKGLSHELSIDIGLSLVPVALIISCVMSCWLARRAL